MIGHKLPNKTKSATVAEPKLFHQLNNPFVCDSICYSQRQNCAFIFGILLKRGVLHYSPRSQWLLLALTQIKHAASPRQPSDQSTWTGHWASPANAGPAEQFPCLYKQTVSVLMHTAVSCGHLKKKQHDGVGVDLGTVDGVSIRCW
jgi:hypothetical protein